MAHSLGYPHPDLMLGEMTSLQYQELLMFLTLKAERKQNATVAAEESDIKNFLGRAIARQKKGNGQ